jgi:H/ACA ribonucleoprotein complex non-core subunit NAF1
MGERVIVEGSVQHNPLNEGSILWITESRMPLGIVDELFGPVKNPYYLVRYNSEEEVPAGISAGTDVCFVAEFADHILNMKELYAKGYDESDSVDKDAEDLPDFSDDEKEAEYKRSLRQAKRQTDRQHEPMKTSCYMKGSQPRGGGIRKPMPPRNLDTSTRGHQPQPHFRRSDMAPAGTEITARSLGPQNAPMIAPTMLQPGPMNPAVPPPVPLANQMGGCFMNLAQQQLLPQQPNMVWPGGFPRPPLPNMGVDGAALAANIMQNLLTGASQFQQQFQNLNFSGAGANQFPQQFQNQNFSGGAGANQFPQQFQNQNLSGPGTNPFQQQFPNQNFSGFPNQMPMPFLQTMHQTGMPANPMPFGGRPPANPPSGPASIAPMGQGNFGQTPNPQGFTIPAPPGEDGKQGSPPQFSSRQFHQGSSSSFGRGRTQHRGGRHSYGRGGRGGRHPR